MRIYVLIAALAVICAACSHKNTVKAEDTSVAVGYGSQENEGGKPTTLPMLEKIKVMDVPAKSKIPEATAFRMSGDYKDNVAITVNNDGVITYFPAPSDITADSRPIDLGNGWWLNCQGIGANSVFTRYTFEKYAELTSAPSVEQLKKSIIPGATVTEFIQLPFSISEAASHIPEIKEYLNDR